jgi:serine/threonine protein kinase
MKEIWNKALALKEKNLEEYDSELNINYASFNVLEYQEGKSLSALLVNDDIGEEDFYKIMFQVFYTLRELSLAGVRHNDIHFGNIYINVLDVGKQIIYFYDKDSYSVINTKYIAKIYDFDNSAFTVIGAPRNSYIDKFQCAEYGMCSNKDDRYDLFIIVKQLEIWKAKLKNEKLEPVIKKFISKIAPDQKFIGPGCCEWHDRRCVKIKNPENPKTTICSPDAVIPSDKILDLKQLCDIEAFPNLYKLSDGYDWGFENLYVSQICGDAKKFIKCLKQHYN